MSEQQPPAQQDTAAVAGPEQAPGTAQEQQPAGDPYEKRYNDLRPQFDRTTQELSEIKQQQQLYEIALTTTDPDTQRQALQQLGYDVPDEVEDVEPAEWTDDEDPLADVRQELAELKQWRDQNQSQAQEAAGFEFLMGHINNEVERLGMDKLDEATRQLVLSQALASPGVPAPPGAPHDELPNVEAAWKQFQAWRDEEQKRWAKTKSSAPYVPPGGLPANEVPDPGTGHNSRMNRAMRSLQEQQE
jgi:hypothetical protein